MIERPTGWYPDPADPERWRWWNGGKWSSLTAGPAAVTPAACPPPVARPWLGRGWFMLTRALQAALLATIAVNAWAIREALHTVEVLDAWQMDPGSMTPAEVMALGGRSVVQPTVSQATLAAVVLLAQAWLYLVHRSQNVDRAVMEHESEWRIAARPLLMANDVHRGLTGRQGESWIAMAALGGWLFSFLMRLVAVGFARQPESSVYRGEGAAGAATMWAVAAGCEIVAAALTLVLTVRIARLVRRRMLVRRS